MMFCCNFWNLVPNINTKVQHISKYYVKRVSPEKYAYCYVKRRYE